MVARLQRNLPALAGLAVGAFAGIVFMLLGSVIYTGEGWGTVSEPPEQVYFF
ncbi:MAG: hypothetical protein AAFO58_08305 [Pseudomonadota bacterium]